jgi:hypothetical protein
MMMEGDIRVGPTGCTLISNVTSNESLKLPISVIYFNLS